jgi:hypothetical protein
VAAERPAPAPPPPALPAWDELGPALAGWLAALAGDDVPAQRAVLAALVDRFEPIRLRRNRYRLRTTWTGLGAGLEQLGRRRASTPGRQP